MIKAEFILIKYPNLVYYFCYFFYILAFFQCFLLVFLLPLIFDSEEQRELWNTIGLFSFGLSALTAAVFLFYILRKVSTALNTALRGIVENEQRYTTDIDLANTHEGNKEREGNEEEGEVEISGDKKINLFDSHEKKKSVTNAKDNLQKLSEQKEELKNSKSFAFVGKIMSALLAVGSVQFILFAFVRQLRENLYICLGIIFLGVILFVFIFQVIIFIRLFKVLLKSKKTDHLTEDTTAYVSQL